MRFFLVVALTTIAAAQTPIGSLEGTVVNQLTGEGLRAVKLTLKGPTGAAFTAETGDDGSYNMQGLEAGSYTLSAERAGFLTLNYGAKRSGQNGSAVTLQAGQKLTGVDMNLQPYGVIAGRVLDAEGEPLLSASVTAMKVTYVNGKKELKPAVLSARIPPLTNDLGEFRIFGLPPGSYYLRATPRGADGSAVTLVATYYPAATDTGRATPIEVAAGKTVAGIDVRLIRLPSVTLRGSVTNQTGATGSMSVVLFPDVLGTASGTAQVKPDGRFEIPGVVPGRYWVLARLAGGPDTYQAQKMVDVTDQPVEDIAFVLDKGVAVSGRVTVEPGGEPIGSLRSIRLSLPPAQPSAIQRLFPLPATQVGDDGSFQLTGVAKDQYELTLGGLRNGYYIKSARAGEVDLRENSLSVVDAATAAVQIVLSGRAGRIDGTVNRSPGATIVLIPDGGKRRARGDWYRTTTADQAGKFAIANVTPGDYKLFAWEDIEDGAWMDPEVIAKVEARGVKITIPEGASQTVQLDGIAF